MWLQKFRVSVILSLFALLRGEVYGQVEQSTSTIYFEQGSSRVVDTLGLHIPVDVERVEICGGSSPDGAIELNNLLAQRRSEAVRRYLVEQRGVADSIITTPSVGVNWRLFREYIEAQGMPYREEVLSILDNTVPSRREQRLKQVHCGVPYDYMLTTLFPRLRSAEVCLYYPMAQVDEVVAVEVVEETEEVEPIYDLDIESETIRPLFALKTNLLFDLMSLVNIELEVPIGRRWSILTELIIPWWTMDNSKIDSRRNRLQLFNGNIEGRYWWGDRANQQILTGWFTGIYSGGGLYDLEYDAKGYQGEFFIAAGVSGGYAHTINRSQTLRLEYSLGVGYLGTNYDYYRAYFCCEDEWHAVRERSGYYFWIGPTRAKVSLSWLINRRR